MNDSKDHKAAAEPPLDCNFGRQVECPCCRKKWDETSEQHASILLFGECFVCRFMPDSRGSRSGTQDDIDAIQAKRRKLLGLPPKRRGNKPPAHGRLINEDACGRSC